MNTFSIITVDYFPRALAGVDVSICIGFNEKYSNYQLVINIAVPDEKDKLISCEGFLTENTKNNIRTSLKEINLVTGRHFLSCWAKHYMHQSIDWVEKTAAFEMHELNTFIRRITPFSVNSKIIILSQWQAD